jgi:MOSC domain-containing protein YiiM
MNLVHDLERGFGHRNCGVLLRVIQGGNIAAEDHLHIS